MAASSIDILSFLNRLAPTSSSSTAALTERDIFFDFFVRLEEYITSKFFPVEVVEVLGKVFGGSPVIIAQGSPAVEKEYTAPTYVANIYNQALKPFFRIIDPPDFDVTPILTLANEKIEDLKSPSPFYNAPNSLTILFYRKLANILNTFYPNELSTTNGQAKVEINLALLFAALRALFSVLQTMKTLYETLGEPRMKAQLKSVERALVETPQLSTSLDLRGIYGETEWQAITYLLLFQDKDFQLTEIDATGLTLTPKIEEAHSIIQHVYPEVSIKVKVPSDDRSVTAAMTVPGVGFHADGGTPASGASPEKENEHICRIS